MTVLGIISLSLVLEVNPQLVPFLQYLFPGNKPLMPIKLLAGRIKEYLSGKGLNAILVCGTWILPDINEHDIKPAFVFLFQVCQDRCHPLAGNTPARSQIHEAWMGESV